MRNFGEPNAIIRQGIERHSQAGRVMLVLWAILVTVQSYAIFEKNEGVTPT
jgi:hypothetical protein